jgi:hypothetical protein
MLKHHDRWASLNPPRKLQNENFWHRRQIWLDCEQQSENSILVQTCLEYDREPDTIIIEDPFLFPTVIYTPGYDTRSKSYEFLNISQAAVSQCWQTEPLGKIAFLTTEALSSQKTCNNKLVFNFPNFPVVTRMLKSDKQGWSYDHWNTAHEWKNPESASDLGWWRSCKTPLIGYGAESG